jgi:hypothetical protein
MFALHESFKWPASEVSRPHHLRRNTNQHFNTLSVFYWDISPFQVFLFLCPTYQATTNTHPLTVSVSFYKMCCCLSHVVTYLTLCQETDLQTKQQVINRFQNWISTSEGAHLSVAISKEEVSGPLEHLKKYKLQKQTTNIFSIKATTIPFKCWDSSVGIATRYWLYGPGIESWWGRDFPHPSIPAPRPTRLLYNGYRVFRRGKAAVAWSWPPTPSSAEVKERVDLNLYPSYRPSWPVLGWTLPLPLPLQYLSNSTTDWH